jgi:peptidoglycan/LPS O-acetylase OafA/YrhL
VSQLYLPTHEEFRRVRFFGSLDGLRALSILGVIWSHVWYVSGSRYYDQLIQWPVLRMGAFGVDVFFTISGFLITTLLLREGAKSGQISLKNFYIRRALRIWPLYYAVLALYVILVAVLQKGTGRDTTFYHFLPGYLTFTFTWFSGFASGAIFQFAWSLSVEEQFYVFWAAVLRFGRALIPVVVAVALIAIKMSSMYGGLQLLVSKDSLPWRMATGIAVPICLGALLALALHPKRGFEKMRALIGARWSAPTALGLLLAALAPPSSYWAPLQWLATVLLIACCVIREDHGLAWFLGWKPLAYIGTVSYGMYMLNTLTLDGLNPLLNRAGLYHPLLKFAIAAAMTTLVASASYHFFEMPFLRMKDRFTKIPSHPVKSAPELLSAVKQERPAGA